MRISKPQCRVREPVKMLMRPFQGSGQDTYGREQRSLGAAAQEQVLQKDEGSGENRSGISEILRVVYEGMLST